jgi:nicotinamide-nucleotide amidase
MTTHPRAYAVVVGDELVTGGCRDENGPRILHELEGLGFETGGRFLLPDAPDEIARLLRALMQRAGDVVIVSGGLGPTHEDRTREAIAEALGLELELDAEGLAAIEKRYAERGRDVPSEARRQALRPARADLLRNPAGRSPGFLLDHEGCLLAVLPGPPRQLREMLEKALVPNLRQHLNIEEASIERRRLKVIGLDPAMVRTTLGRSVGNAPGLRFSVLPLGGEIDVLLTARVEGDEAPSSRLGRVLVDVSAAFGDHLVRVVDPAAARPGADDEDEVAAPTVPEVDGLMATIAEELTNRGWSLVTAESCTGGMVAARVTGLAGSSDFFRGAVVAYSNDEKTSRLGVAPELLESLGAVSGEVARAMAEGGRRELGTDVSISVTGIAGPAGGTSTKPVGLVFVGVSSPNEVRVTRHLFRGDRETVRTETTAAALDELRRLLRGLPPLGELVEVGEPGGGTQG